MGFFIRIFAAITLIMSVASINSVYQMVMRRAAKEENGFISPTDFNTYARSAQQTIFQSILSEYRKFLVDKQRYLSYWKGNYDSIESIEDDLRPLRRNSVSLSSSGGNNVFQYPSDFAYFIDLEYDGNSVTLVDAAQKAFYVNSYDSAPSTAHPVAIRDYNSITMLPNTITSDVALSYFKTPKGVTTSGTPSSSYPTWAFTTVNSKSIYNATNSIDFELPAHLEYRLATQILLDVGIEIREGELFQMAQAQQVKETQDKQ